MSDETPDSEESPVGSESSLQEDADATEVTVWAPAPTGADHVPTASIEEWIACVAFESTADAPLPDRLDA